MTNATSPKDPDRLTLENIVTFAEKQQELAFERFTVRRGYEWKVSFGLWTALGAASGLILNASEWRPNGLVVIAVTVVAILTGSAFAFVWIPWVFHAAQRDGRTGYWWNSVVEYYTDINLPEQLRPGNVIQRNSPWERYSPTILPGAVSSELSIQAA